MSRISKLFQNLKNKNKAALGIFITAGDPNIETSQGILEALPPSGADFIELGMPFSDPMADGPSIQLSSNRALKKGTNISKILRMVKIFREKDDKTPIILMGYFNPIYIYGVKKFLKESKIVGVDAYIIVDLPPEEDEEFCNPAMQANFDMIKLVTPTSNNSRIKTIIKKSSGFIYYVSVTGITGTKKSKNVIIKKAVNNLRTLTKIPILVGFGIRNSDQVKNLSKFSDGVIVGSYIVDIIKENLHLNKKDLVQSVANEVKKLSSSIYMKYDQLK